MSIIVDQIFNPESPNAQSGTAVQGAMDEAFSSDYFYELDLTETKLGDVLIVETEQNNLITIPNKIGWYSALVRFVGDQTTLPKFRFSGQSANEPALWTYPSGSSTTFSSGEYIKVKICVIQANDTIHVFWDGVVLNTSRPW